jgi:hypothetical protein
VDPPDSSTSWVDSIRSSRLAPQRPSWKLRILRWLGLLAIIGCTIVGMIRVAEDRSLDLPWDGPTGKERYGLYGNGLPQHWVCGDGHDHYSLPYWMLSLACAVPTALFWFVWPRKRASR